MKKNKDGFAFPAYGSGNRAGADGSTVKEKRFRYSCHYNVRHPGQCDGQSGYGVTKLDAIVESIVCTKFSEILECSKSKLLQDMLRKDMEVAQKEVSRAKSELDLKENACTFYIWHQVYRLTRVRIRPTSLLRLSHPILQRSPITKPTFLWTVIGLFCSPL